MHTHSDVRPKRKTEGSEQKMLTNIFNSPSFHAGNVDLEIRQKPIKSKQKDVERT